MEHFKWTRVSGKLSMFIEATGFSPINFQIHQAYLVRIDSLKKSLSRSFVALLYYSKDYVCLDALPMAWRTINEYEQKTSAFTSVTKIEVIVSSWLPSRSLLRPTFQKVSCSSHARVLN